MLLDAGGEGADPEGVVHEGAEAVAEGGEPLYWLPSASAQQLGVCWPFTPSNAVFWQSTDQSARIGPWMK